jgi:hypothetical protein
MIEVGGGIIVLPNDAGACPSGMELGASGRCDPIPTYTCATWPVACMGAVSCSCASVRCPKAFMCINSANPPSATFLTCIQTGP